MRVVTQIEKDFEEAKKYWSQVNADTQRHKKQTDRSLYSRSDPTHTHVLQTVPNINEVHVKVVFLPMLLHGRYFQAMVDTGSTLTLMQETCWKQVTSKEPLSSSRGQ